MNQYFVRAEYTNSTGNTVSRYFFVSDVSEQSARQQARTLLMGVHRIRNITVEPQSATGL